VKAMTREQATTRATAALLHECLVALDHAYQCSTTIA
jgi:hypothetical protein